MDDALLCVEESDFSLEIREWNECTLGLLKVYADWKIRERNDSVSLDLSPTDIDERAGVEGEVNPFIAVEKKQGVGKKAGEGSAGSLVEVVCTKCRVRKPISEFNRHKTAASGYNSACRSCMHDYYDKWYKRKGGRSKAASSQKIKAGPIVAVEKKQGTGGGPKERSVGPQELKINELAQRSVTLNRAPNNTKLFLDWVEGNRLVEFDVMDFVKKNPPMVLDDALKVVVYLVSKSRLMQLSRTKFRVL